MVQSFSDLLHNNHEAKDKNQRSKKGAQRLMRNSWLTHITPRKGFTFHSDYYTIDNGYATIMTILTNKGSNRHLPAFWGVPLMPTRLGKIGRKVTTRLLTMVNVTTDDWYKDHDVSVNRRMNTENMDAKKQSISKRTLNTYKNEDLRQIARDHLRGDQYMWVAFRLLIKAPSLKILDKAVDMIDMRYKQSFAGLYAEPYQGRQRKELSNIFKPAKEQLGKNYMFTSSEFAGEYNLVTQGISDEYGEYVGQMKGDVNHSAIVWDLDLYNSHTVVASSQPAQVVHNNYHFPPNTPGSALWCTKIAQSALANGHRVVNLVLNGAQIGKIGQDLSDLSLRIGLDRGAINPFEMFGERKNSTAIFARQVEKLSLMAQQINNQLTDVDLNKNLVDIIQQFYIDERMWHENPVQYFDDLRLVGLPHNQYPKLDRFDAYINNKRTEAANQHDLVKVQSIERLESAFSKMLNVNADIFNSYTSPLIDEVKNSLQITYDFSSLVTDRGDVAMAEFVNVLSFAVGKLDANDVVILHGAEQLTDRVKTYTAQMFDRLMQNHVRIVYAYDSVEKMLRDADFCHLSSTDYLLTGMMTQTELDLFENVLNKRLPEQLKQQLQYQSSTFVDATQWYLRRNYDNIIFAADPFLGVSDPNLTATQQRKYRGMIDHNRIDTLNGRHTGRVYIDFKGKTRPEM